MDVEGADMEEVEVEVVHFEVKGWRLRRCILRSKGCSLWYRGGGIG